MTIEESSYAHIMNNKIKYHCEALHFGLTYWMEYISKAYRPQFVKIINSSELDQNEISRSHLEFEVCLLSSFMETVHALK